MKREPRNPGARRSKQRRHWPRVLLLALSVWVLWAVSCAPGFDAPSDVNTLRIISVTTDKPYALPGDDVTFRMTVFDGYRDPLDPQSGARTLQIVWIGGCFDPEGDQYFLCFEQLAEVFGSLEQGQMPPPDVFKVDVSAPTNGGEPDSHDFTITLPEDIISRRPVPDTGPHYGIAYVFFAACAGQIAPAPLESLGGTVPEFPLQCLDPEGNKLGSESFVVGYTQVYSFGDGRLNNNPPISGITIAQTPEDDAQPAPAGEPMTDSIPGGDATGLPNVVERCPVTAEERRAGGCGSADPTQGCTRYTLKADLGDVPFSEVAELDPDAFGQDGQQLNEVVWVSYYVDGGDLDTSLALVGDAIAGEQTEFETVWTPPDEPGVYTVWAVIRDQRGGASLVRRFVRVQ